MIDREGERGRESKRKREREYGTQEWSGIIEEVSETYNFNLTLSLYIVSSFLGDNAQCDLVCGRVLS